MIVEHLEVVDFRNYTSGSFDLTSGTTVVIGDNGQGKTNLVEALGYLATLSSFRGGPERRHGADRGPTRRSSVPVCATTTIARSSSKRRSRSPVATACRSIASAWRGPDLLGTLRITVFSPDDLSW